MFLVAFKRRIFQSAVIGVALYGVGCTKKEAPKVVIAKDLGVPQPTHADAALDPLTRSRLLKRTQPPAERNTTLNYRTAFRAVLSAGFRFRPKGLTSITVQQCKSAFRSMLKQPDTLVPFLTEKLSKGRIFERPLAIKLLGRVGEAAQPASRYISDVVIRSWKVQFNRCLKKAIKWTKGMGQELDAHPDVRAKCRQTVMKKPAGVDVQLACEALTRIGTSRSRTRLIESGVGGAFIKPCVGYLVTGELNDPATLAFVAEEMYRPANASAVMATLVQQQAVGLRAGLKIDQMRRASKKYVGDGQDCLLGRLVAIHRKAGTLGAVTAGLEPTDFGLLDNLSSPPKEDAQGPAIKAAECMRMARDAIKGAQGTAGRVPLRSTPVSSAEFDPFCPSREKG
ncbi:MAG: hypothetical protein VX589_17660 [Myxococcota bacterium]|nr:hypothetical protein [Myxococcota bacterium]